VAELNASSNSRTPLGLASLLALGINGIVGVGIFFVPAEVATHVPGLAGLGVYALTALGLVPIAVVYATLGGRFPEDGGPFVWARAAFGPLTAFCVGWVAFASALFSTSAVTTGLCRAAAPTLGLEAPWQLRVLELFCIGSLVAVVGRGLRPSAVAWNTLTVLKLLPLLLLAGLPLFTGMQTDPAPVASIGALGIGRAALIVVFAMQGFEIVAVPAGAARGGSRAIPLATLGSLAAAAVLYLLLHAACVRALPDLAASPAPLVEAARVYGGEWMARLVAAGTNVSALGIALGMFAMTPRYLAALGRADGLGTWIGAEDERRVPRRALASTGVVVSLLVLTASLGGGLETLFALSSVAVLAQYAVSSAALLALGLRGERRLRRIHLWPVAPALLSVLLLARGARTVELAVAGGMLLIGLALFLLRRRRDRAFPTEGQ